MAKLYGIPEAPETQFAGDWSPERIYDQMMQAAGRLQELEKESLGLYEPQDIQAQYHACTAPNVILIGGTRAGKTLCGCVEDARCVTNQDPHKKYPKKGVLMLLGYGWNHVGRVFYPMLFLPGAFRIIRDLKTGQWRAFRPWTEEDREREGEAEDAPPLIPPRLYDPKDIAWEAKGQNQFVRVKLKTGWEVWAFSSESDPRTAQGFRVNRIHVDEDLSDERWIGELTSRKAQDKGVLHWTAVPHSKNESMLRLVEFAEKEKDEKNPKCVMFRLPFLANKHIDEEAKKTALAEWANEGEDVLRMRSEGEFTYDTVQMYPSFSVAVHGFKRSELPNREVPKDWTRFAAIDPGHQVLGVLFGAIPPTNDMVLAYDELYLQQCDAEKFGDEMLKKTSGYSFYAFIIDAHGARLRDIGGGVNVWDQYQHALAKRRVSCELSGHSFSAGCDVIPTRAEAMRLSLRIDPKTGKPKFRILVDDDPELPGKMTPAIPHFVRTMKRYRKKQDAQGRVMDEPNTRGDVHMAQVGEYLISFPGLEYVPPKPLPEAAKDWEAIKKQHDQFLNGRRKLESPQVVHFGPASSFHRSYA